MKMKPKEKVKIFERDYLEGEELEITKDVYNLTIAANMTQACAPLELSFCIKQCILVFVIQFMVAIYWTTDFLESDDPNRVVKYTY